LAASLLVFLCPFVLLRLSTTAPTRPTTTPATSSMSDSSLLILCPSFLLRAWFRDGRSLTVALTLHIHWGIQEVIADYARPYVIVQTAAKAGRVS
ncbi:hypothetical protein PFISCL1PPCAC_19118, partial [Pristionchus fissidentatus]